jgi:hypothetical protein
MTLHPEAFPVSVQFGTRKDHIVLFNGQMINAADLGTLELIKVEYETFLVGHRIKNGNLHSTEAYRLGFFNLLLNSLKRDCQTDNLVFQAFCILSSRSSERWHQSKWN